MLLVRELLLGPRRYSELLASLPGLTTNLLAARLRALEAQELVARVPVYGAGRGHAYELSERGRALEPALQALAAWGGELVADGPRESTRGITISPAAPTDCAWAASAVAEAELIAPVPTTTGIPAAVSRATPSIRSASLTSGQSPIDPQ